MSRTARILVTFTVASLVASAAPGAVTFTVSERSGNSFVARMTLTLPTCQEGTTVPLPAPLARQSHSPSDPPAHWKVAVTGASCTCHVAASNEDTTHAMTSFEILPGMMSAPPMDSGLYPFCVPFRLKWTEGASVRRGLVMVFEFTATGWRGRGFVEATGSCSRAMLVQTLEKSADHGVDADGSEWRIESPCGSSTRAWLDPDHACEGFDLPSCLPFPYEMRILDPSADLTDAAKHLRDIRWKPPKGWR